MNRFMRGFGHRFRLKHKQLTVDQMNRFMRGFGHRLRPEHKQLTLAQMRTGQSGIVIEVRGGRGISSRLSALGVRAGLRITKVGSMFMRGPTTVQVGNAQVAIGFGMANKIIVEPRESQDDAR